MVEEEIRLKRNRMWIKWTELDDGLLLKYHEKWFKKPGDEAELIKEIKMIMKGNNKFKEKRLKVAEPKRSQVKYADAIDRVKHIKKWKEWEDLESGADKNLKYHGRIYRKDVPDDEEKLMTQMINDMNHNKRVREKRKMISTASILVNMRERKEGINDGGIGNDAGDDDDRINDGGGKNCSFDVNDEKNEDDKNGEEDADDSNEKKEG